MRRPDLPAEGRCRCGNVRIRIVEPPLFTAACHCTGCQRMSSSAFALTAGIPDAGFEVTHGTVVPGGRDYEFGHKFCPVCMSWVFTKGPLMPGFVNLRPTMLEDPSWLEVFMETYTLEKLAFAETGARRSYERFPTTEELPGLIAEYAALIA